MQDDVAKGRGAFVSREALTIILRAFESAGAHSPEGCTGDCPAPMEHRAIALIEGLLGSVGD